MKVAGLAAVASAQLSYLNVNQEEILRKHFGGSIDGRAARALSEEDVEDKLPGLPDDIANYRDDSGCIILVGAGSTNQKAKYLIGKTVEGSTFASCAAACLKNENCRGLGYAAKSKKCEMFTERFYEIADANHVVMKVSDGSLWYDRVCVPRTTDYEEVVESLNGLSIAFHSYHLARRVSGYGKEDGSVCDAAKAVDSAAGFTFYHVKPNNDNVMTSANVIARCKTCGLRPACYTYKYGHTYNYAECENIDKYFDTVGYPSGGKTGTKELQRVLAKRVCGSDNVTDCGNKGKLASCAAIKNWSSGSACCSKGGWCNPGNNDKPSQGYSDLCAYVPGKMDGYTNTRN